MKVEINFTQIAAKLVSERQQLRNGSVGCPSWAVMVEQTASNPQLVGAMVTELKI